MTALTLSYSLTLPPADQLASTPNTPSADTFTRQLATANARTQLESLELALGEAREWLNLSLTEWKLALSAVEKERKQTKRDDEDDQEAEE